MKLRKIYGCALPMLIMISAALSQSAMDDDVSKVWPLVYDFMVQDVCIDALGHVLPSVSPLDGVAKCPLHRNLRIGEMLPYHKHDWADVDARSRLPSGDQREDSFPIQTRALGTAVAQIFDFGANERAFAQFDHGDGGQIVVFSHRSVSIGLTEDGGAGLQFFYGPACKSADVGLRFADSWIVVDHNFVSDKPGRVLAMLTRNIDACPGRLSYAFTQWHIQPVSFHVKSTGVEGLATLNTLISEHFGGRDVATAEHLERFYFTRELGLTRWERWQNLTRKERPNDRSRASILAANERCEHLGEQPMSTDQWFLIDCRQWTNIVPASNPQGDPPNFWVDLLRSRKETRELLID